MPSINLKTIENEVPKIKFMVTLEKKDKIGKE